VTVELLPTKRCPSCDGSGEIEITRPCRPTEETGGMSEESKWIECSTCSGWGVIPREIPTEPSRPDDDSRSRTP
jgi:DnaJ-class molecular chaperone